MTATVPALAAWAKERIKRFVLEKRGQDPFPARGSEQK